MKAISLWQPWAWAILYAGKDVENRIWRTHYRGPLLLHAAKRRPTVSEMRSFSDLLFSIYDDGKQAAKLVIEACEAQRGGIVGRVDVVDCVRGHESRWAFEDQFQWVLENAQVLPFKAVKGERGFFEVDYDAPEPAPAPKKQLELL